MRPSRPAADFRTLLYYALALCVVLPFAGAIAKEKKVTYIAQTLIDSQIDKAFYLLNSASDPASGMTMEQAIAGAKDIATKLRAVAANDANQKYILWKVSELEGQIYLEEQGLTLEREQYRQKSLNDQIAQFNAELGKNRPSFKDLWAMHGRMAATDKNTAIDVENSIKKRAFALAKEVPFFMEAALEKGNIANAQADLVYCQANRDCLGLSPARYAALEAKVAARTNAEDQRRLVTSSLDRMRAALAANKLGDANRENSFLRQNIGPLRSRMVSYEWNRLNKEYELLSSKLTRKEDSCVAAVTATLRSRGPSAAAAKLDTMRSRGVSQEKVSMADHKILETVIALKQQERGTPAVAEAGDDSAAADNVVDELVAAAKKKAKEKNDSLAALTAERSGVTQIEQVRRERLRVALDLQKMRMEEKRTSDKQRALQELVAIYTSIELHRPQDAYQQFSKSKNLLKKNIPSEDFKKVAMTVEQEAKKK
jgi:hypothetical protein